MAARIDKIVISELAATEWSRDGRDNEDDREQKKMSKRQKQKMSWARQVASIKMISAKAPGWARLREADEANPTLMEQKRETSEMNLKKQENCELRFIYLSEQS